MAASPRATVKNERYNNRIRSGLGLKYLKEGLQPFVTDVIKLQHEKIVGNLRPCNTCSLESLLPHHALKVGRNCNHGRKKCLCIGSKHTIRTHCPTNVCGHIYDKIVDSHFGDPNFSNTDITKWVTDPWELAKCYINAKGYKDQTSAEDTDCLGLLSIIINDMEFHGHLSVNITTTTTDTFSKVRQDRNKIMHSSNLEITDADLKTYIQDFSAILDDPTRLRNEHYAIEARTKLQKLLENGIYISTTDEISLIREAQISVERNSTIQADSLHDIVQSLDQMKEENQDRFEGLDKAQDSLRKAIDDINDKSIDQQKLASDLQQVKNDLESMNTDAKLDHNRIVIIEKSLSVIQGLLQKTKSEKMGKEEEEERKNKLDYLERKNALKERLFEIYKKHLTTVPISPILEEMRSHIDEIYVDVVICEHFLKVQVGESIKRSKATGIDCKDREVKNYEDIFVKNGQRCLNLYMLGDPGIGKTTWCMRLVNDWVNCSRDHSIQKQKLKGILLYELIVLVFLRNATQEVKIIDMIKEQLFSEGTEQYEIFVEVLRKEPDKCLVIVDGLDEWIMPNVSQSLTQNQGIPSKAGLNGCPLLITTRPSKLYDIRLQQTQFDQCIKIEGVKNKDKQAEKLIKALNKFHCVKVPKQFSDFKKSYEEMSLVWQKETATPGYMENPLLLLISVCIWFQYGKLEKTLAGNYSEMLRYLFEYALNIKQLTLKIPLPKEASNASCRSHLLPEYLKNKVPAQFIDLVLKLAKFAFESLFNESKINDSKLVFAEEKLKTWFTDFDLKTAVNCGILSKSYAINQPLTRMTRMSFLHKRFQEFLSAVHIVGQFQNEIEDPINVYQKYCRNYDQLMEMENVLLFVCGLDPRAASKMSLNLLRVKRTSNLNNDDGYDRILTLELPLKCTMQVHEFSDTYPSAEYPIYVKQIEMNGPRISRYSDAMDYICYMYRSNIANIKQIKISQIGRSDLSSFQSMLKHTDNIQFVRNFFGCELTFLLEECSFHEIDMSGFTDCEVNTFGKWFENLTKLESLQMIDLKLPCTMNLCLQNCCHLNNLYFRGDIQLLDTKTPFQIQCLVLNLNDGNLALTWLPQDCEVSTINISNSTSFQCNLHSLVISNASVLETELFIKSALSSGKFKCVHVSTEILEQELILDLVSCRHLEVLEIRLSRGQFELVEIVETLKNAQYMNRLLMLQDSRVLIQVVDIVECLKRSHNSVLHCRYELGCTNTDRESRFEIACSDTDIQETENIVRFAVNNFDIEGFALFTESIDYETLVRLIECEQLNQIKLILSNIKFNQIEKVKIAIQLLQNYEIVSDEFMYLKFSSEHFNSGYSWLFRHACQCTCESAFIQNDGPVYFKRLLRILSSGHLHLFLTRRVRHTEFSKILQKHNSNTTRRFSH